jgi:hypothetical protein
MISNIVAFIIGALFGLACLAIFTATKDERNRFT